MSFPRYPKYKDIGVEWLGEVPEHWQPTRLGMISSLKGRLGWQGLKADEYRENGPYVVSSAHFQDHRVDWAACPRVSQERYDTDCNIQLAPGDVLLMKDGAAMGKLAFIDDMPGPACLNSHLLLFRPITGPDGTTAYIPRFVFYFMQTGLFQEHIKVHGTGATFLGVSQATVSRYAICLPPLREQIAIAAFLDREVAKIDAVVADQQRLTELLNEKRQAVISHAVTKGVNQKAPMKDSGTDWLGEIPAHWGVQSARRLFRVRSERAWEADEQLTASQKYGMISQREFVEREGRRVTEVIKGRESLLHVEPDDFVISMRSFQGGLEWCRVRGSTSFHYVILTPIKQVQPRFFALLFKSFSYIQALRTTTDLIRDGQELRYSNFVQVPLPIVPAAEQEQIAEYVERELHAIDVLLAEAQRTIDLLQERRTALISAAVTGQIDVRKVSGAAT